MAKQQVHELWLFSGRHYNVQEIDLELAQVSDYVTLTRSLSNRHSRLQMADTLVQK